MSDYFSNFDDVMNALMCNPICYRCGSVHVLTSSSTPGNCNSESFIRLFPYKDSGPCPRCGRELCLGPGDCLGRNIHNRPEYFLERTI